MQSKQIKLHIHGAMLYTRSSNTDSQPKKRIRVKMLFTCISCVSSYIRVKAIITDILYYEEVFDSYLVI